MRKQESEATCTGRNGHSLDMFNLSKNDIILRHNHRSLIEESPLGNSSWERHIDNSFSCYSTYKQRQRWPSNLGLKHFLNMFLNLREARNHETKHAVFCHTPKQLSPSSECNFNAWFQPNNLKIKQNFRK